MDHLRVPASPAWKPYDALGKGIATARAGQARPEDGCPIRSRDFTNPRHADSDGNSLDFEVKSSRPSSAAANAVRRAGRYVLYVPNGSKGSSGRLRTKGRTSNSRPV